MGRLRGDADRARRGAAGRLALLLLTLALGARGPVAAQSGSTRRLEGLTLRTAPGKGVPG